MKDKHYHYLVNWRESNGGGGVIFVKGKKFSAKLIRGLQKEISIAENLDIGICAFFELECDCDENS